jgi:galactose oxidase-like protein
MRHASHARRLSQPWTGFKKVLAIAMIFQQLTLPSGAFAATKSQTGQWSTSTDIGVVGTHVVLMREPQTNAAKVFLFGESGYAQTMKGWRFFAADTVSRVPSTSFSDSSSVLVTIPHPIGLTTDLFCSGHTVLPDGRMLLLGGSWVPPTPCGQVYTFNPDWMPGASDSAWTQSAAMAVERWYATATMLSNGRVLATAGTARNPMIGFGGEVADSSWGTLQPLGIAARYMWMDTLAVPGDGSVYGGRIRQDSYTFGKRPASREGHVLMGLPNGRAILFGGRHRTGTNSYQCLNDVWYLQGPVNSNDSTHTWRRLEVIGDSSISGIPVPCPRTRFAATWGGVEDTDPYGHLGTGIDSLICFIQGGMDSTGKVLGDLWRGELRPSIHDWPNNLHYGWQWKRLMPDDASTARYGHSMNFDPGPPTAPRAPHGRLLIFGGKTDTTTLASNDLYTYGVGRLSSQPDSGLWRTLTPSYGSDGVPSAREGHATCTRWLLRSESDERQLFLFGGEDVNKAVVAPALWYLARHDVAASDTNAYAWEKVPPPVSDGPSGRTRATMAFSLAGKRVVVVGGDTNGDGTSGGLTNEIWNGPVDEVSTLSYGQWVQPKMRNFPAHPGPPPIAGMSMFSLGDGRAVIATNLETFDYRVNSPADSCEALPGAWYAASRSCDSLSERPIADYSYMFLLPDGRMFNAGPTPQNPTQPYKRFYNLSTMEWVDSTGQAHYDSRDFGSAVMYRPGKVLRAGGHGEGQGGLATSQTETISIGSGAIPGWSSYGGVGQPNLAVRTNHNLTLLPTGDVLATGGLGADGLIDQAVH